MRPIIGITADIAEDRFRVGKNYAACIDQAGGIPIILPPILCQAQQYIDICAGFVFTGGDDPIMEQWGIKSHPSTTPCDNNRQKFETSLLELLLVHPDKPVFGICLGMQWMGLLAGGILTQDLNADVAVHHKTGTHSIEGEIGRGIVHTSHHQAMSETGTLTVTALADDGVIEAVRDLNRKWYVGVQWHPERTEEVNLGQGLFNQFCEAATT
jgi:putative glutamine amidotransferase